MKKTIFLLFFSCCIMYMQAGPYYTGLSQLNKLLTAVGEAPRDIEKNDNNDGAHKLIWKEGTGPQQGWIWDETKTWPASPTLDYGNLNDLYFLSAINWSSGNGNGSNKYKQVANLEIRQAVASPTSDDIAPYSYATNPTNTYKEKNELRKLSSINLSGNEFYHFSFDASNRERAVSTLSIDLSNNIGANGKTTWQTIILKNFVTPAQVTLNISNNGLGFNDFAAILDVQAGINVTRAPQNIINKKAIFPVVDLVGEIYSANTTVVFFSGATQLAAGTDYTANGNGTFTFGAAYSNQTVTCKLTDPAFPDFDANPLTYNILLADNKADELESVTISFVPNSSTIYYGETIQLTATALNFDGNSAAGTNLLWECIPAGAGNFSSTSAATTVFTPSGTDPVQIKCTATQNTIVKSDTKSFTFAPVPNFVTVNVTGAGNMSSDIANTLGSRIPASGIRHLRLTGDAMNHADGRLVVSTFPNLVTLDLSGYNQDIPDAVGGVGVFEGLPVKRIRFREGGGTIGAYAFQNCKNLVFARLDKSKVEDSAFAGCDAMTGAAFHRDKDVEISGNPFPAGIKVFVSYNATRSQGYIDALPAQNVMNGQSGRAYSIATADELNAMVLMVNQAGALFELAANIDLDNFIADNPNSDIRTTGWVSIGTWGDNIRGAFDGKGYVVSNLWMTKTNDQHGLFGNNNSPGTGNVNAFSIKNLGVIGHPTKPIQGQDDIGGIAGRMDGLVMENCYFKGTVKGRTRIGGLVGRSNSGTTITNCYAENATIEATGNDNGGLIGETNSVTMTKCYFKGTVSGAGGQLGGLIGYLNNTTAINSITKSFVKGTITKTAGGNNGNPGTGGLVGFFRGTTDSHIKECFFSGTVTGQGEMGGLVGKSNDQNVVYTFQNCYVTGTVQTTTGADNLGGLIGFSEYAKNPVVDKCYITASIISSNNGAGGVFGSTRQTNGNVSASVTNNFILCDQIKKPGTTGTTGAIFGYGGVAASEVATTKAFSGIAFSVTPSWQGVTAANQKPKEAFVTWSDSPYTDEFAASNWDLDNVWYRVNGENYHLPVLRSLPLNEQPQVTPAWLSDITKDAEITIAKTGDGTVTADATAVSSASYTATQGSTVTFTITKGNGYDLIAFDVNGTDKMKEINAGKYVLLNAFGKIIISAVFAQVGSPEDLAKVSITPVASTAFVGEWVEFTAEALNFDNNPASGVTYLWSCNPPTAGSFVNGTTATPTFISTESGSIEIKCEATQAGGSTGSIMVDKTVTITPTALTSLALIAEPALFSDVYLETETVTLRVRANGASTNITRSTFLKALVLTPSGDLVVDGDHLKFTPSGKGTVAIGATLGSVSSTPKNLRIVKNNQLPKGGTGMTVLNWSSIDNAMRTGDKILDGVDDTKPSGQDEYRWAALQSAALPDYVTVDLGNLFQGNLFQLDMIEISWEAANASTYEILTGDDVDNLSVTASQTGVPSGKCRTRVDLKEAKAKILKINCTARASNFGSSIYEIWVYGELYNDVGADTPSVDGQVVNIEYFNLQGMKIMQPVEKGRIYIVKKTLDSGKVVVEKVVY